MLSLDKHLFEQRQQLTICWRCSLATQCAFDGHVLPLPTLLTHAPMTLLAVLNGMHRDSQGEVVGEGTVWTGCPAKPLGHRQTADFRCDRRKLVVPRAAGLGLGRRCVGHSHPDRRGRGPGGHPAGFAAQPQLLWRLSALNAALAARPAAGVH